MACNLIAEAGIWLDRSVAALPVVDWARWWATLGTSFSLVAAAEFGDKSQLVSMTLAARHRAPPILLGAVLAFALLNLLAVLFGAALARWLPQNVIAAAVAVLFGIFGIRALLFADTGEEQVEERTGHGIFLTTFLMIFLAELGDKTEIAVAGLGAAQPPVPVWIGATLALGTTSALGIWAGRTILQKIPPRLMHRIGGVLFLGFAVFAAVRALPPDWLEGLVGEVEGWWRRVGEWGR